MKLFNTLTKSVVMVDTTKDVGIYSCGPTVYNDVHIGNLVSFIIADTLRRTVEAGGATVKHVMNFTDIDDKTIKASKQANFKDSDPHKALRNLTRTYESKFLEDMQLIGNDNDSISFLRATENIEEMKQLILKLHKKGIAYLTDDGIYFSIEKYKASGKIYGQLVEITEESTGAARVDNDEYEKDHIHDFALWKKQKNTEPAWEFMVDGNDVTGRPGWHIECSAMSTKMLSQPFAIHTGGVDLAFPHHENEIAQSTGAEGDTLAEIFLHNEHLLVDGKKMSKSLGNFYTLKDIVDKGYDPLAFRVMTLQGHYRKQTNFSWTNIEAAQHWLNNVRHFAELRWQPVDSSETRSSQIERFANNLLNAMQDDLDSPKALAIISESIDFLTRGVSVSELNAFIDYLQLIDNLLGLHLLKLTPDASEDIKKLIAKRQTARAQQQYEEADSIRDKLNTQGFEVRDSANDVLWQRSEY